MGLDPGGLVIVRTPEGRLASGRIAWREGERGRMRPTVVVDAVALGPDRVEVLEADPDRAEQLEEAGYRVSGIRRALRTGG